ncbi:EF-Tu C-terminal domain-related protein [Lysobacter sp. A286]
MKISVLAVLALSSLCTPAFAAERVDDTVGFGSGQAIPVTLSLNFSEKGRDARMTPIRDNYRPKVRFGGRDVVCMFHLPESLEKIAPGESGEVSATCKEPVSVSRASTQFTVVEGGKTVGSVIVHLPPPPAGS